MADKKIKGIFIPEEEVNEILEKIDKVLNPSKKKLKGGPKHRKI